MISVIYVVIFVNLKSFIIKKIIFGNLLLALPLILFFLCTHDISKFLFSYHKRFLQIKESTLKNS